MTPQERRDMPLDHRRSWRRGVGSMRRYDLPSLCLIDISSNETMATAGRRWSGGLAADLYASEKRLVGSYFLRIPVSVLPKLFVAFLAAGVSTELSCEGGA